MRAFAHMITAAFLCIAFVFPAFAQDKSESAYDRVIRTGVLRCAYFIVPPEFNKDPNTGVLSGIGYEVTEAAAKALSLKIEWVREIGFAELTSGLNAGHYDAVCSSVFNLPTMGREAEFTIPFMYTPVGIYVRADDARFDQDRDSINSSDVTIATIDGETAAHVASGNFPKAKTFSMPQNTNVASLLESVATGKADVTFTYAANFSRYNKNNPGKLKSIHQSSPVRAFGNTIVVPNGDFKLKFMLDTALQELINSGAVNQIIAKYEEFPGSYYRVNRPYEVAQ